MSGRRLDVVLVTVWLAAFFVVAMAHPGVANLIIALGGALLLGWYNTLVRHDPKDDSLRSFWQVASSKA
jgi:hypothetical protein